MMHKTRRWGQPVSIEPDALAPKISESGKSWTSCTAWRIEAPERGTFYVLLNDQTSEDGAGEWAIMRPTNDPRVFDQVETITFGWCDTPKTRAYLRRIIAGEFDSGAWGPYPVRFHEFGAYCELCA